MSNGSAKAPTTNLGEEIRKKQVPKPEPVKSSKEPSTQMIKQTINLNTNQLKLKGSVWRCTDCRNKLGFVTEDKSMCRVKYKDMYVFSEGGRISVVCRNCGGMNTLADEVYLFYLNNMKEIIKIVEEKKKEQHQ